MKGRLFWEKRTLKKFRIIFESGEIIVGADRKNKYQTFRKDSGQIAFSRREVLEMRLNDLTHRQKTEAEKNVKKRIKSINDSAFGFNFG
jgi:hypothetical protein